LTATRCSGQVGAWDKCFCTILSVRTEAGAFTAVAGEEEGLLATL